MREEVQAGLTIAQVALAKTGLITSTFVLIALLYVYALVLQYSCVMLQFSTVSSALAAVCIVLLGLPRRFSVVGRANSAEPHHRADATDGHHF